MNVEQQAASELRILANQLKRIIAISEDLDRGDSLEQAEAEADSRLKAKRIEESELDKRIEAKQATETELDRRIESIRAEDQKLMGAASRIEEGLSRIEAKVSSLGSAE